MTKDAFRRLVSHAGLGEASVRQSAERRCRFAEAARPAGHRLSSPPGPLLRRARVRRRLAARDPRGRARRDARMGPARERRDRGGRIARRRSRLPRRDGGAAREASVRGRRGRARVRRHGGASTARHATTARHPRWALAYKFAPREATTTVRDIVVQVGRTGTADAGRRPQSNLHWRGDRRSRDAAQRGRRNRAQGRPRR